MQVESADEEEWPHASFAFDRFERAQLGAGRRDCLARLARRRGVSQKERIPERPRDDLGGGSG